MKTLQLLLLLLAAGCMDAYKPVILVHGVISGPNELQKLSGFITKAHPGTEVIAISLYDYGESLTSMWQQVESFRKTIMGIMKDHPRGVHLLCFSQGGLICRGVLSTMPNHNVHTFIGLSSPLAGQYGETSYLKYAFPFCLKKDVFLLCYNQYGQQLSVCNYWNDPHHRYSYLWGNNFLPLLNGERRHSNMNAWRRSFIRIKKLVLIGGPDDGVITPWQSSHFGFYDRKENVIEMKNQKFYQDDTFGLRTLDERGDISVCIRSGVKHINWHSNFTVFMSCMEEWLT
ncbi:lysosomal thioesterase PPT2-A-like isoform X2 [Melanotaenia boesemani]|uniref:lysosomal thioesterase PPT2-A-like isoform X2 n=1 Tax=Melanotaenia boesemani TaxID=1250792 RepID=UPI001C059365|nr:lysosomal thioesterase PPT2-A-like isoform X2 [Melanotaenia boesemani]